MDFLTLCLAGKILRKKTKIFALIFSAGIGAAYGVAAVIFPGNIIISLIINIAVSALMCYIVFGRPILISTAVFNISGLLIGGAVTAAYMALNKLNNNYISLEYNLPIQTRIPFGWTAVISVICGIAAVIASRVAAARHVAPEITVEADCEGRRIEFNAITDSGNLLCEPLSGAAVIITCYYVLAPLLPPELYELYKSGETELIASLPLEFVRRVRLIPARGASGGELFLGFIPDRIKAGKHDHAEACLAVAINKEKDINKLESGESHLFGNAAGIVPALFG